MTAPGPKVHPTGSWSITYSFEGEDLRPIRIDRCVLPPPTRGEAITLVDTQGCERTFLVRLVGRQLWAENRYNRNAKPESYIERASYSVVLVCAQRIAEGKALRP